MNALKCDRCGRLFEVNACDEYDDPIPYFVIIKSNLGDVLPQRYDICPECGKSLTEWYHGTKEEPF